MKHLAIALMVATGLGGCVVSNSDIATPEAAPAYNAFTTLIDRPATHPNGAALLIGGGYAHDEDWSVPGQYTITGQPHADAAILSAALTARGLVVMRYSLSANPPGDPLMGVSLEQSIEIARDAMRRFRQREPEATQSLFLIAHSLGTLRAARIADDQIAGIVWLAPAYATPQPMNSPLEMQRKAQALYNAQDPRPAVHDFDGDGLTDPWEITRWATDAGLLGALPTTVAGGPIPIDTLRARNTPLLALFGELDPITLHAPALTTIGEVVVFDGLGHNLSEEGDGLIGPIADGVAERIAKWCVDRLD